MSKPIPHYSFKPEPLWFSYMNGGKYNGHLPAYYKPEEFSWVAETEKEFTSLKQSIETYLQKHGKSIEPYFLKRLMSEPDSWRVKDFFFWGNRNNESCDDAPEIEAFFKKIPGLVSASISLLHAGAEVTPHCGDTNTVVRGHLGLTIPAGLPACGFEVAGEKRAWLEGKWLLFTDAHEHRAWNHATEPRAILIIDVLQPHLINSKKNICSNSLSLIRLQQLELKNKFVRNLPGPIRGMIRYAYKFGFYFNLLRWS
ncbi:MAG: aspartyl/asparaginyl beta-hydroxylase domain-containing protein [Bacteroidia bacterium]